MSTFARALARMGATDAYPSLAGRGRHVRDVQATPQGPSLPRVLDLPTRAPQPRTRHHLTRTTSPNKNVAPL